MTEWRQGAHVWYDIDSPGRGGEERCALVSVAGYERFRLPSEAPEGWAVLGERFAADKGYRGARAVMVWREPGSDTIKIVVIHPDIEPIGLGAVIPYLEPWDASETTHRSQDTVRLDWLARAPHARLEDVRGRCLNNNVALRAAIDWFMEPEER